MKIATKKKISARFGAVLGSLLTLGLVCAPYALASDEQVGTFSESSYQSPTFQGAALAVNTTGAGGVPAGTVYAVASGGGKAMGVNRYSPTGEFVGAWGREGEANILAAAVGVTVDQTTGDVYTLETATRGQKVIRVYSPDGSKLLDRFGEAVENNDAKSTTLAETPEDIHQTFDSGMAVDSSGAVYVSDESVAEGLFEGRVMVFKPQSPGDYEHYVYTGRENDIAYGHLGTADYSPRALALDSNGDLYLDNETAIYEFAPGDSATPVCKYAAPSGGLQGLTANPATGELYYFSVKHKTTIGRLGVCNAEGKFVEAGSFSFSPAAEGMRALAFNPIAKFSSSRPAGILYGLTSGTGEAGSGLGYIFAPAEAHDPAVESESAVSVDSGSATVSAEVNPNGSPTHYVFQYIGDAAYQQNKPDERFVGAGEAPLGSGVAGSGTVSVDVSALLLGLSSETEYHYRIVASSHCNAEDEAEVCEGVGPAQSFRTYPSESPGLPDGRVYELVSPPLKNGGEVFPLEPGSFGPSCAEYCRPGYGAPQYPIASSPDGESLVYYGNPFSASEGERRLDQYISRRGASGWQTTTLSPALHEGVYLGFDAGLTEGVLSQSKAATLSPPAPAEYPDLYAQPTAGTSRFDPLSTVTPPNRGPLLEFSFAGGSADYSHLFFGANDALTGETAVAPAAPDPGVTKDDLYESANGELKLVNVLPGNSEVAPGAVFGSGELLKGPLAGRVTDYAHAISADGSRVFWSGEAGQVYVREDGQSTTMIPDSGRFLTASADGSKVLLSDGHIYDLESKETVDLTGGAGGFEGVLGQSEDLSHIYFVDKAALTGEEANEQGESAQSGQNNLYSWQQGVTKFVATLGSHDIPPYIDDWVAAPQYRTAQASPDGRWLAFMSVARLTGYDNTPEASAPGQKECEFGCAQVFLYDSSSDNLVCASCNPSGVPPLGRSHLPGADDAGPAFEHTRFLTAQGRVYFDSVDSLSPFDTNYDVEDVYEYEPDGVGDCRREAGCVRLISGGRGDVDSDFLAVDATGKNVFFDTRDRLVPADTDELLDVYDAREGGGVPEEVAKTECNGETCQPPVAPTNDPALASLSFEGASDLISSPVPATVKPKAKGLSRAQKLARALRECKQKPKRKRAACQRQARKRFGVVAKRSGRNGGTRGI